jgi:hypothetical protein
MEQDPRWAKSLHLDEPREIVSMSTADPRPGPTLMGRDRQGLLRALGGWLRLAAFRPSAFGKAAGRSGRCPTQPTQPGRVGSRSVRSREPSQGPVVHVAVSSRPPDVPAGANTPIQPAGLDLKTCFSEGADKRPERPAHFSKLGRIVGGRRTFAASITSGVWTMTSGALC